MRFFDTKYTLLYAKTPTAAIYSLQAPFSLIHKSAKGQG